MNFSFVTLGRLALCMTLLAMLAACGDEESTETPVNNAAANNSAGNNGAGNNAGNNADNSGGNNAVDNNAAPEPQPEIGELWPEWSLQDFQPQSERFEESYGSEAFEGKVTFVAFLAGWCSYCRTQAVFLEGLSQELKDEGYDINFVAVNAANADEEGYRKALVYQLDDEGEIMMGEDGEPVYRCSFPLLQDTDADDAWGLHKGGKDDFFIYDAQGKLLHWFPIRGDVDTNLSHPEVLANLKAVLIEAADAQ